MEHGERGCQRGSAGQTVARYRDEAEWLSKCLWYRKQRRSLDLDFHVLTSLAQVLFFDDRTTIHEYQAKFPLYASKIPTWATQSNGMHQLCIWIALEQEGLGANLQHYNPLIDSKVADEWDIPCDWELSGQLVFGNWLSKPNQKTYKPVQDRFKVYGVTNWQ